MQFTSSNSPSSPDRHGSAGGDLAFAAVVATSYLALFSGLDENISALNLVLLLVAGTVYILVGIYGFTICSHSADLRDIFLYFLIQIPLGGLICYLGHGGGFNGLLMLPLAGHAVILLNRKQALGVSFAITTAYLVSVAASQGWHDELISVLATFIAGLVFVMVFTQITVDEEKAHHEIQRLADELTTANARLREYAAQVEDLAIAKERNRMAREIHDGLGHYLTAIHMQIQAAQALMPDADPRATDALDKARALSQDALIDVRRSVSALRDQPNDDRPLPERLHDLLAECESTGISTHLEVLGTPAALSPQVELTLYRTAQEGLNNTRKHSQADSVRLCLDYRDNARVRLVLEDDGVGSDDPSGGFGLLGMRERAHLLDGEINIQTAPGSGFSLELELPV
ncbi:MAG: sensor histidine kinase [Anaerolineaceae bacterium]